MKMKPVSIVPISEIPLASNTPLDLVPVFRLLTQMEQLCYKQNGIGLSASQIGIPWRLFVVYRNNSFEYYLNCEYKGIGPKSKSIEGCLSLRNPDGELRRFEVERYSTVEVKGIELVIEDTPTFREFTKTEKDLYAIVFQHEIDHDSQREKMIDVIGKEIELIS